VPQALHLWLSRIAETAECSVEGDADAHSTPRLAIVAVIAKIPHGLPDQHDNSGECHECEDGASPRSGGGIDGNRKGKNLGHERRLLAVE